METFRGLLYVKHGRLGSKSEGPDYYLQTSYGDYLLHFKERLLFEPDYQLEYYCRRMVAVDADNLGDKQLQVQAIQIIPGRLIPHDYERFEIKMNNTSQFEISNLQLGMVGSKNQVSIESLPSGSATETYEFLLKYLGEEPAPISHGDYQGVYVQNGENKNLFIPKPGSSITVHFNDDGFTVQSD